MRRLQVVALALLLALLVGCVSGGVPETTSVTHTTAPAGPQPTEPASRERCLARDIPGDIMGLSGNGTRCLALYCLWDSAQAVLALYDLEGQVLAERVLDGAAYEIALLPDGTAVVLDWTTLNVTCYDGNLIRGVTRSGEGLQWRRVWEDGTLCAIRDSGVLVRTSLPDGATREYALDEELSALSVLVNEGSRSLLEYTDEEGQTGAVWLDWETGALELCDGATPVLVTALQDTVQTVSDDTYLLLRYFGDEAVYALEGRRNAWLLDGKDGLVLLSSTAEGLEVWQPEWGYTWEIPGGADTWTGTLCGWGVAYARQTETGTDLWYLPLDAQAPDGDEGEVWTIRDLDARNRADAAAVRQDTGVRVLYGQQGASFNDEGPTGYLGQAETDPLVIHLAMEQLRQFTESYPEGIFREMLTEPVNQLVLYLSGPLSPDGENSLLSAVGFTTTLEDTRIVVMNLEYAGSVGFFRQSLAHEFMHVMEDRIYAMEAERGIPYLSYWESFEPGEDAYFYSYFDANGLEVSDPAYTAASDLLPTEVSFLDSYSRSYPNEDRARILEYLYAGEDGAYAYLYQGGRIREKAEYLCAVIRACFETCREAETLPWETLVEPADFSEYQSAVETYAPQAKG